MQLKGRHADLELLAYMASGALQCYNFTPQDMYWGELAGALEALDAGTTFVLDHAHGCRTAEHAQRVMDATLASGIRSVVALAPLVAVEKWDREAFVLSQDVWPAWVMETITKWGKELVGTQNESRVLPGLGFDLYFLPKEMIQGIWKQSKEVGVKLISSHLQTGAITGNDSKIQLLKSYGLLEGPEKGGPGLTFVAVHANGMPKEDLDALAQAGFYVSSTPETEAQMGIGKPMALDPGVKASLGIDCHCNNSSSIMSQARTLLQLKRQETNQVVIDKGGAPKKIRGTTTEAFNLATIDGARAVGLEKEIGSLEVGKKADIVVFDYDNSVGMLCAGDHDPLVAVVRHSEARDIEMVIVDGVIRKKDGKLVDVVGDNGEKLSWREVARQTRASQAEINKRIEGVNLQKAQDAVKMMFQVDESKIFGVD